MPPDRRSPEQTFDINLLDTGTLNSPGGFQAALRAIEGACHQGDPEITGMISALINRSHILEYIFSGTSHTLIGSCASPAPTTSRPVLDNNAYEKLSGWIVSGFPTPTTPGMMDTMSMKLLRRLSSSLLFAEYPSAVDAPPDLRLFWRKVDLSSNVLNELQENAKGVLTNGSVSPTNRKGKKVTKNRRIDPLPFDSMGIVVPSTDAEIRDAYVGILSQLQNVLKVRRLASCDPRETKQPQYYLLVLRKPLVSEVFKSSYTKVNLSFGGAPSPTTGKPVAGPDQPRCSAFPMVQPMKAALYFDDVEGFGEWSILLSTRAQKDLRYYKRADGAMFRIVMKKIKWDP